MGKTKVRYNQEDIDQITALVEQLNLNTVCREAGCPNIGECYKSRTATFMIMGRHCTRNCRFCNVNNGTPEALDDKEPVNLAEAVRKLGLRHVVITSVTRDDLQDGGAAHFARTIEAVRALNPQVSIEVLIPDLKGNRISLERIIKADPEVINHNLETVSSLYREVRPEADYRDSLQILNYVKDKAPHILTKTGIMVGLGETDSQVYQVMDDALEAGCDIFTIGQYLQPSKGHVDVKQFISQERFAQYEEKGRAKGFKHVASGPLVRSSYRAGEVLNYEA